MKTKLIFILLLFGTAATLKSQTLFPLNVGDKWRYWEYPTYFRIVENLEDTVLSNNKMYYHFSSGAYYRQEGDSVFIYDFSLNDEYLIFDFSAEVGDTITNIDYPYSDTLLVILTSKGVGNYFGHQLETWNFYIDETGFIDDEASFTVADSLGITDIESTWIDESLAGAIINGVTYGNITAVENIDESISEFQLFQNYPNPFNPTTKIQYSIPQIVGNENFRSLQLKIYDVLGNEIATLVDEQKLPGTYEVEFNAASVSRRISSGVYFYRLISGKFSETKKFVLMK